MTAKLFRHIFLGLVLFFIVSVVPSVGQADAKFTWMGKNILKIKEIPVTVSASPDKLILSDSPEMVKEDGILYQDTVQGDVRLFFHHVNDTSEPKKIFVLLINRSAQEAKIDVNQFGLGGPGLDYMAIGKYAQNDYFHPKIKRSFPLSPGKNALLDLNLNFISVQPGHLVNGIYDFYASVPVTVAVVMSPPDAEPMDAYENSTVLPTDKERLRGTFPGRDRVIMPKDIYSSTATGLGTITLADNKIDKYSYGIDATDGSKTQNYGNYGVMYRLFLPSSIGSKFSVFLNPRGGVYAGSVNVEYQHAWERTIETPGDRVFYGETSNDFTHLGNYDGGHSLWLTFSPPGASNLPVKLIIAPHHFVQGKI